MAESTQGAYEACSGNTDETHRAVTEDTGPTCPDEFLEIFLPKVFLPSDSPDEAIPVSPEQLNQIVRWVTHESGEYINGRWKSFTKDPVEYRQPEATVFAKLCGIVNAIHNAVERCLPELHSKLGTRYYTRPSKAPETAFRYNLTRPDGYFVVDNDRSRGKVNPDWIDIAVTGEFKKGSGEVDIDDDVQKILWNMHHILRADPERRFTFGYTIENRTFRMWFASRSEIVVSEQVDWFNEPEYIIRSFFAFMYADKVQMGWDPTMKLLWGGDVHVEPQYEITVSSKDGVVRVFRTVSLISAVGAESIRGRGTRVWKVLEVVDGELSSKYYVLKDAWVDSDRPSEGDIVAEIRRDAERELDETDEKNLTQCLLTTVIAGNVMLPPSKPDAPPEPDTTISGRPRRRLTTKNKRQFPLKRTPKSSSSTSHSNPSPTKGHTPDPESQSSGRGPPKTRNTSKRGGTTKPAGDHRESADDKELGKVIVYGSKTHYRIVFEEVCEVLHEVKSLQTIMWALMKACIALKALHKLGWVHRDISSGNIMIGTDCVKIADFEYAKKMTKPGKEVHDVRTGTEDFMSVEVRSREYKFIPRKKWITKADEDILRKAQDSTIVQEEITAARQRTTETQKTRTWFYNPLHDFESIFWLTLNFFTNKDFRCISASINVPEDEEQHIFSEESADERHARVLGHWNFGRTLFAGRSGRFDVLSLEGKLESFLAAHPLHPALFPLCDNLNEMRQCLVSAYEDIEQDTSQITHQSAPAVSTRFIVELYKIVSHIKSTRHLIEIQSLRQAIQALPKSYQRQRVDAPPMSESEGEASTTSLKRSREDDKECDEGGELRKSKSPRTSAKQQSASTHVVSLRRSVPAPSPRRRVKRRTKRRTRPPAARPLPPTAAPFVAPAPAPQPPQPLQADPPPQHAPPATRVLRSHIRAQKPGSPSSLPIATRTRKVATTAVGKKSTATNDTKAKATAKAAMKVASKAKPKTRARKGRGS